MSLAETSDELERALSERSLDRDELSMRYRQALLRLGAWQAIAGYLASEEPTWREVLRIEQGDALERALTRFRALQQRASADTPP